MARTISDRATIAPRMHALRSSISAALGPLAALLALACTHAPLRMSTAGDVTREHTAAAAEPADDAPPPAWLWEVSHEGSAPSYVLGTMHIGVLTSRALPPPLDEHLYGARAVVMEIDPREAARMLTAPGPRRRVARREMLDRALPPQTWALLSAELAGIVPADVLRAAPPGLIVQHLRQVRMAEVEAQDEGRVPVRGAASSARLDQSIFEWAVSSGRPVVALETPEQAMTALAAVSSGSALDALRSLIDEAEAARTASRALRAAYLGVDEAQLMALLAESGADFREILLLGRNRAWMERLIPELEQGSAFVAVGLAHLLGDDSVLAMLAERGFTIRRVGGTGPSAP